MATKRWTGLVAVSVLAGTGANAQSGVGVTASRPATRQVRRVRQA